MWLWILTAWAGDDTANLDALDAELAEAEALAARARTWEPTPEAPDASGLREELIATAKESITWGRTLVAIEGRLNQNPKKNADLITRAEATQAAIDAQRGVRQRALTVLDIRIQVPGLTADDRMGYRTVDSAFHKLHASTPEGETFDALVMPALVKAQEHEQWRYVHGWAVFCTLHCADPEPATKALAELPESVSMDNRWKALQPTP